MKMTRKMAIELIRMLVGAIVGVVALGLFVAYLVQVIPGGDGNFSDWLQYWGQLLAAIVGAIVGAIIAAYISQKMTIQTQGEIDSKRMLEQYKFEIQIKARQDLHKKASDMIPLAKKLDEFAAEQNSKILKYFAEKVRYVSKSEILGYVQLSSNFAIDDDQRNILAKLQAAFSEITSSVNYPIFKQITTPSGNLGKELEGIESSLEKWRKIVDKEDVVISARAPVKEYFLPFDFADRLEMVKAILKEFTV